MQPSDKVFGIESFLEQLTGVDRKNAITQDRCVPPPIGCGKPVGEFRDEISRREFSISGLCQSCQDSFFGIGEEDEF